MLILAELKLLDKKNMYTLTYTCMYTTNNTFSVTDLRHKTSKILSEAKSLGYVQILNRSRAEAAVVDIEYLKALQEAYEDHLDIKEYDETVELKRTSFDKYLKQRAKKRTKK